MPCLKMFVIVHECCKTLDRNHKLPLLVWVDHPLANLIIEEPKGIRATWSNERVGMFHLVWLGGLTGEKACHLRLRAVKDGFEDAKWACDLPARQAPIAKGQYGGAPHISSPTQNQSEPTNFVVSGYTDDPSQCPCSGWLVDGGGNTYPGSPLPGQMPPNYAIGFQNIPGGSGQGTPYTLYVKTYDGVQTSEPIFVQNMI